MQTRKLVFKILNICKRLSGILLSSRKLWKEAFKFAAALFMIAMKTLLEVLYSYLIGLIL